MRTAVNDLLLGMREAMTIWLALVGFAAAAFVFLSGLARRSRASRAVAPDVTQPVKVPRPRRSRPAAPRPAQLRCNRLAALAEEQRRYAEEVAVAAGRAGLTAQRLRAEWVAAQRVQQTAWRAFETADRAAQRVARAAAFPVPDNAFDADELAARERTLHRAATTAHQRGELTVAQLLDVLCHRDGWDPRRHPFDHEAALRRLARERALAAYRAASVREQTTWQAADLAAAAKRSLDDEAFAAAVGARRAQNRLAKEPTQLRARAGVTGWPTLATR